MNNRFKNPYFWIGLIGIMFSAAGIDLKTLTSWDILLTNIINILNNPFLLISVIMAITGVFIDPTTEGAKDCQNKQEVLQENKELKETIKKYMN